MKEKVIVMRNAREIKDTYLVGIGNVIEIKMAVENQHT